MAPYLIQEYREYQRNLTCFNIFSAKETKVLIFVFIFSYQHRVFVRFWTRRYETSQPKTTTHCQFTPFILTPQSASHNPSTILIPTCFCSMGTQNTSCGKNNTYNGRASLTIVTYLRGLRHRESKVDNGLMIILTRKKKMKGDISKKRKVRMLVLSKA